MTSKFRAVLDGAKGRETEPPAETPPPPSPAPVEPPAPKKRGRPGGKRSDPAYEQVTAYIRGETYRRVKVALIEGGDRQEFSQLVEELLAAWLEGRR